MCVQFHSVQHIEDIEWERYWNPKLYVENSLGEPQETIWQTLLFNGRGEATVYERRRIKGCFLENLELDEFPFDTQVTRKKLPSIEVGLTALVLSQNYSVFNLTTINNSFCPSYASCLTKSAPLSRTVHFKQGMLSNQTILPVTSPKVYQF